MNNTKLNFLLILLLLLLGANPVSAIAAPSKYRGWDHLVKKLVAQGVDEKELRSVFGSKRMPEFDRVTFKMVPGEPKDIYTHFRSAPKVAKARENLNKYRRVYNRAESEFGVDREVIAAILLVETQYGTYTGKSGIFNRLARLANIDDPENIRKNYKRLREEEKEDVTLEEVEKRARYVAEMFEKEIPALLSIAKKNGFNVFNMKGSSAGAFGLPQFLPSSYVNFAVDGNGDGRISLYQMEDAILSTANFLKQHGWKADLKTEEERKEVIWHYNHSEPYVATVLAVANLLK